MNAEQAYKILENNTYKNETEKQNCLDIIKTSPQYAFYYAVDVIEGRWIEGEEYIKKESTLCLSLCNRCNKRKMD